MNTRIQRILTTRGRRRSYVSVPINLGGGRSIKDPAVALQYAIREALDPVKMPGQVRTLKEMTQEERVRLEQQYGAEIKEETETALVSITVRVLGGSEKAIKVRQGSSPNCTVCWLPRSVIVDGDVIESGCSVTLKLPMVWLRRRNLRRDPDGT